MSLRIYPALSAALAVAGILAVTGFGTAQAAPPAAAGSCRLASVDEVTRALHVTIVRAEPSAEDKNVCEYSIKGKPSSAATDHSISMAGALSGQAMDPAAQKLMQGFGNAVLGGQDTDGEKNVRHPGEAAVLIVDVHAGEASEMAINRQSLGYMQPVTPISGLGDEAFSSSQSMLFVRKGGKILRIMYTGCPCTTKEVEPLARQIVAVM